MSFSITSTVKHYPALPYEKAKRAILGARYELSLTFVGASRAQALNATYRNKTYIPNVLSFPLDETMGEIFICPKIAKKEAKNFSMSYEQYILFLFIHGCLHLKGFDHGDEMDALEMKYLRKFYKVA